MPQRAPLDMTARPEGWQDADEERFKAWYQQVAKQFELDPNPDEPLHQYNYRHAFKAGAWPDRDKHWPSEFKAAGHPNRFVNGMDTATGEQTTAKGHTPVTSWDEAIKVIAKEYDVWPELALAVAKRESSLDPNARGDGNLPGGSVGLFQLRPAAAGDMGVNRDDPLENIVGGVKYLKTLQDRYRDPSTGHADLQKVLMAYNGGPDNVDKGSISPAAQAYAAEIIASLSQGVRTAAPAPVASHQATSPGGQPAATPPAPNPLAGASKATSIQAAPGVGESLRRTAVSIGRDVVLPAAKAIASSYDPRTEEGRQNVAATAGAGALTYATGGASAAAGRALPWVFQRGIVPWIARISAAPLGAGVGGGTASVAEDVAAGRPVDAGKAAGAAVSQAGSELVGQATIFPVRHAARAALATKIARDTRARLGSEMRDAIATSRRVMGSAKDRASDLAEAVSEAARRGKVMTSVLPPGAGALATSRVPGAEIPYAALANTPPNISATETAIRDVLAGLPGVKGPVEGAAARALTEAGQKVRFAAQQGPEIDFAPIKQAATALGEKFRPTALMAQPSPEQAALQGAIGDMRAQLPSASNPTGIQRNIESLSAELARMEGAPPNLPGLLGLIENGPDRLGFEDAHKLKMLLDEAVNWDVTAKKHLERITKGLRTTLRDTMRGANPAYDQATSAYEALVPLYRRGAGKQVVDALVKDPDNVANLLTEKKPLRAVALRKLLVDQSAAGGDAPAGELAWNLVRSQYTYRHLIEGGPAGLTQRVQSLVAEHPDFAKAVYGDTAGQQTLSNLAKIGGAYDMAVGTLQQEARGATRDVSRLSRQFTGEREQIAGEARRLGESSLGPFLKQQMTEGEGADFIRAIALGPSSRWGVISGIRLLANTPKAADIVEWASQSDSRTRAMTRALFSPLSDRAAAAFWRGAFSAVQRNVAEPSQEPKP